MIKGLVSVVTPSYKRAETLTRAIDSVMSQTYTNVEMLIVDDNIAGDEYSERLHELVGKNQDPRVRLITQPRHINGAAARNAGIREAQGEYIAFLDDDDFWDDRKIEIQVDELSQLDDTWGAVSCLNRVWKNGKLIRTTLPYRSGDILIDVLDRRIGLGTGSLLIRRAALDDAGYFDENLMRHQDLQLFANLSFKYKIRLVKKCLHNIDADDGQNRPSAEKLQQIKQAYFSSISSVMDSLSPRNRKKVMILHDFETAFQFYKAGDKKNAIKNALHVFSMPETLYLATEKIIKKTLESKLCLYINKKYEE